MRLRKEYHRWQILHACKLPTPRGVQEFASRPSRDSYARHRSEGADGEPSIIPFELEVLEEALQIAMGKMDTDLQSAQSLMQVRRCP